MAGSFGYEAEHYDTSIAMAELSLMPAVRKAPADALIVADGTSCRHQIADGANRQALHVAEVLAQALLKRHHAPLPARGRGWVRGPRTSIPPHLTSPLAGERNMRERCEIQSIDDETARLQPWPRCGTVRGLCSNDPEILIPAPKSTAPAMSARTTSA